ELGQIIPGQIVEVAARQHLTHRREAIAVEARAIPDADDVLGGGHRAPSSRRTSQPTGRLALSGRQIATRAVKRALAAAPILEKAVVTGYPGPSPQTRWRSSIMAVPKRRMSRANTRSRRAQWKAERPQLVNVTVNGQQHKVPRRLLKAARLG